MPKREFIRWSPPVELSAGEEQICKRCKRVGRMYAFLRRHRHELFDDAFQAELTVMYKDSPLGAPTHPPAMLGLVILLQALTGLSDAAAVEAAVFDLRWRMVLDCADVEGAPFSQGSLVDFRARLLEHGLHLRLVERSVQLARETRGFGAAQLRVALDSAPLWGCGRVEDTFNLIGHALEIVLRCVSVVSEVEIAQIREQANLELTGGSSLKAKLDIDWDDDDEQHRALQWLLAEVQRLRSWVEQGAEEWLSSAPLNDALEQLARVISQDLEPDPDRGGSRIREGTARDRQISISDPEMRHGRKSRSRTIQGYKRFIVKDLDQGLILGVLVQPANQPESEAAPELHRQSSVHGEVSEFHIDRGFLASETIEAHHASGGLVIARPWVSRNRSQYPKERFSLDLEKKLATCPAGQQVSYTGRVVQFSAKICDACAQRDNCTRAKPGRGRTVTVHPQEEMLAGLREAKATPEGRQRLRERVDVEHGLAHICNRQGRRARYRGVEKNTFDLARYAVIENLFVIDRSLRAAA